MPSSKIEFLLLRKMEKNRVAAISLNDPFPALSFLTPASCITSHGLSLQVSNRTPYSSTEPPCSQRKVHIRHIQSYIISS